jgi:hypothetical protein
MNKKQKDFLEANFNVYEDKNELELEQWTKGGVDMIIYLDKNKDIIEQLEEYINNFDIDNEIDLYRQDKRYREAFKITESVKDFEQWINYIKTIINVLKVVK